METENQEQLSNFTPLNIYNGTLESVPKNMEGQLLPINELKGNPPVEDCPISNLHQFKEMMNEQHESLFESISNIEETNNKSLVETLSDSNSECECLKEVETKSNLEIELEQVKETEPLKEVELSKEPELVKEVKESKKSIWHYLNPLSWKFSKNKK